MMKINLDRIEEKLRNIFEDRLVRASPVKGDGHDLIDALIQAMQADVKELADGERIAPHHFIIWVPPTDLNAWQEQTTLLQDLVRRSSKLALENGFTLQADPSIELRVSPELPEKTFHVAASPLMAAPTLPDTAAMDQPQLVTDGERIPLNAFLVVGGKTNYPLDKAVINIGRHSDNDLVIADGYVSRHHAQLRAINRRFVVFDAGSTGGLFLNGKPVSQATLQPGDVIRIGATNLIYIQDSTADIPTTAIPLDPDGER